MNKARHPPGIKGTLSMILEFLFLVLKVLYYICEGTYTLFIPRQKKDVSSEIVLVTGAGFGTGRELAFGYASLGATVICSDINKEANEQTMNKIKKMGKNSVYAYRCDLSDKNEIFEMAEKIKKEVGNVTILVNNASFITARKFQNYSTDEISKIIDVNILSHYWMLKAFLPNMIEKNHGHVVAVSSIAGLRGSPNGTLYCVPKAAIRILMESLFEELRIYSKGKSSVKLTTILPAIVSNSKTTIANVRFPCLSGPYSPQQAASLIIDAQRRDYKEFSLPSFWLSLAPMLRILPDKAQLCIMDFMGIYFDKDD